MSEARLSPSGQALEGEIAPGDFEGQLVFWSVADNAYVPIPVESGAFIRSLTGAAGGDLSLGSDANLLLSAAAVVQILTPTEFGVFVTDNDSFAIAPGAASLFSDAVTLSSADGTRAIVVDASGVRVHCSALGFYDVAPVARPVITGVLTQQQVDSLVSALVALGLVTDGR